MSLEQQLSVYEKFAIELALEAGKMMKAASGQTLNIDTKASYADLVTQVDRAVEVFLFGEIAKRFPDHKTIGEESSDSGKKIIWTNEPTWIIDPIDGTTNFVHTLPFACVAIGLTIEKQVVLGVVYSPFLDKLYTAKKGCGAFCNSRPIKVRSCRSLQESLVFFELGGSREAKKLECFHKNLEVVAKSTHSIRALGSAAIHTCFIAEGFADLFFEFGIHCWDICGASLILEEAGGAVLNTDGSKFDLMARKYIAAGDAAIGKALSELLPVHLEVERDD